MSEDTDEQHDNLSEKYCDEDEHQYGDDTNYASDASESEKYWITNIDVNNLPHPEGSVVLGDAIGEGTYGRVFKAQMVETGRDVAVKVVEVSVRNVTEIVEEFNALKILSLHPNFPSFYGAYLQTSTKNYIWLVMELCSGGSIIDLVNNLKNKNQQLEEHVIAFVLKEIVSAVQHMHRHHIVHRDIKGHNILLTSDGRIKVIDFGVSSYLNKTLDQMNKCVGTPYWMAPEVITCENGNECYDSRCDIWSIGITAIELCDGLPPLGNLQPILAMFQIFRNPPPTLASPLQSSELYNDFISECLIKNPDHRPCINELKEHPFITDTAESDSFIMMEMSRMLSDESYNTTLEKKVEVTVKSGYFKIGYNKPLMQIHPSDLAVLDEISNERILENLEERLKLNQSYTFGGDVLLSMNQPRISKVVDSLNYEGKARSDSIPHIYAVADSAYQQLFHHNEKQIIVVMGEAGSGKTENAKLAIGHLAYLGRCPRIGMESKIKSLFPVIESFGNAKTARNKNSSRFLNCTDICFSKSGKVTGAVIRAYLLEKDRIVGKIRKDESNYHCLATVYCGMKFQGKSEECTLDLIDMDRHRFLPGQKMDETESLKNFLQLDSCLCEFAFNPQEREVIYVTVIVILLLGQIKFEISDQKSISIQNPEIVETISKLLKVDIYKLKRILCSAIKKVIGSKESPTNYEFQNASSVADAMETVDSLATLLYIRLFDWIINLMNSNLYFSQLVFGDSMAVSILDPPGFQNGEGLSVHDLFFNITSELLLYFVKQKMFANECVELDAENVDGPDIEWSDNRNLLDVFLSQSYGVLHTIAAYHKEGKSFAKSTDKLAKKHGHILQRQGDIFKVQHFFGQVNYSVKNFEKRQLDAVPAELIKLLQSSKDPIISSFFTNTLKNTGNLNRNLNNSQFGGRNDKQKTNTLSKGCKSQLMYTPVDAVHLGCTLALFSDYLVQSWPHLVICVNPMKESCYSRDAVNLNLNFFSFTQIVKLKRDGYSHRVSFKNFLDRYKFLGFEVDENVVVNGENCRLLLLRLLMEGWLIGKTKVLLKYHNVEYLSRLYENHVKKVVRVQAAVRRFLAKLKKRNTVKDIEEERIINEAVVARLREAEILDDPDNAEEKCKQKEVVRSVLIIQKYYRRWKFMNMYQVFQKYRMYLQTSLVEFCQQVHIYNQEMYGNVKQIDVEVDEDSIEPSPSGHLEVLCRALPKFNRLKMKLPVSRRNSSFVDTTGMLKYDVMEDETEISGSASPAWNSAFEQLAPQRTKYISKRRQSCDARQFNICGDDDDDDDDDDEDDVDECDQMAGGGHQFHYGSSRRTSVTFSQRIEGENKMQSDLGTSSQSLQQKQQIPSILKKCMVEPCVKIGVWKTSDHKSHICSSKVKESKGGGGRGANFEVNADEFLLVKSRLRKVKKNDESSANVGASNASFAVEDSWTGPVDFRAVLRKGGKKSKENIVGNQLQRSISKDVDVGKERKTGGLHKMPKSQSFCDWTYGKGVCDVTSGKSEDVMESYVAKRCDVVVEKEEKDDVIDIASKIRSMRPISHSAVEYLDKPEVENSIKGCLVAAMHDEQVLYEILPGILVNGKSTDL